MIGTKHLKILHGTLVNGVQDRLSLFRDGPLEIIRAGGGGGWGKRFGARILFKSPLVCRNLFLGHIITYCFQVSPLAGFL